MVRLSFILFLLVFVTNSFAAVVATIDRTTIALNETLNLRYESSDEEPRVPDFSAINKDFDIVGQNRQSSVNIINGRAQRKTIFELSLAPKRTGVLQIPEIEFANAISASISVNVKQSLARDTEKDFNFTITADKTNTVLQEQILITVKIERAVNANQESLSELSFSHDDVIIEPLSDDFTRYEAMINGRRHVVYERQYALFPQKTGQLLLNPVTYSAVVPDNNQRRRGFFDDPFFGRSSGKTIRERSATIRFNIGDKPLATQSQSWLPAANVSITSEIINNNDVVRVGDSITQVTKLTADQQLVSTLPDINFSKPSNAQIYPDQSENLQSTYDQGIRSIKTFRAALVPEQAGEIVMPAQTIDWWNTNTQRSETVVIPEKRIEVLPAISPTTSNNNISINNITNDNVSSERNLWFYIALFSSIGWFSTLLFLVYKNKDWFLKKSNSRVITKKDVMLVAETGDVNRTKDLLLRWARCELPNENINSLDKLKTFIQDSDFITEILNLQASIYSAKQTTWDHKIFIQCFKKIKISLPKEKINSNEHILFKIK